MRKIAIALITAAFAVCAHADVVTLTLSPTNGTVAGAPGTAVGWGFTITDSSPDEYVVLDDSFSNLSPVYGTYMDYIVNQFDVAGPAPESSTISQSWNPSAQTGIGEFDLYASDSYPQSFSGTITVDYSLFTDDPNDPNFDPNSFVGSGTASAAAGVEVTPEPSSWIMLCTGLVLLMGVAGSKFGHAKS